MVTPTANPLAVRTSNAASVDTLTSVSQLGNQGGNPVNATLGTTPQGDNISISTLATRLSTAATETSVSNQGLSHNVLSAKLLANQLALGYELTGANKEAYAKQVPIPADAASAKSAADATAFVAGKGGNPFAGMSREQLSTIANDESGTFTVNEKRAAYTQAYNEEEAWREQVARASIQEYRDSGKATNFFKEVLAHYEGLPPLEQALYPENYAEDLTTKIKLDFNYFTHSAGNAPPSAESLANTLGKPAPTSVGGKDFDISDLLELAGFRHGSAR